MTPGLYLTGFVVALGYLVGSPELFATVAFGTAALFATLGYLHAVGKAKAQQKAIEDAFRGMYGDSEATSPGLTTDE